MGAYDEHIILYRDLKELLLWTAKGKRQVSLIIYNYLFNCKTEAVSMSRKHQKHALDFKTKAAPVAIRRDETMVELSQYAVSTAICPKMGYRTLAQRNILNQSTLLRLFIRIKYAVDFGTDRNGRCNHMYSDSG